MNATGIVSKAKALKVRLWIDGNVVRVVGPIDAVEAIRPEIAKHKAEVIALLRDEGRETAECSGALIHPSGGAYLPWGPYLSPEDISRMRAELAGLIEALSELEGWGAEHLNDVIGRAMRGPLSDLMPNLHHFRSRLTDLSAAAAAREVIMEWDKSGKGGLKRRASG